MTPIDTNKLKWWATFFSAKPLFAMGCFCVACVYITYQVVTASYERELHSLREEINKHEKREAYYENRKKSFEETIRKRDSVIDFLRERDRTYLIEQLHDGRVSIKAK